MAVMSDGPGAGHGVVRHARQVPQDAGLGRRLGAMTHYAGAAVSVALMLGVGLWGYRILVRDVNGIPVVRAMEGPMRIASEDPGGSVTTHAGLAVNAIAAVGEAAPPEDVLLLAPSAGGLAEEDMDVVLVPAGTDMTPLAEAPDSAIAAEGSLTATDVLALADQIAAGVDPLSPLAPGQDVPAVLAVEGEAVTPEARFTVIPADVPGVSVSLRPQMRPSVAADVLAALASAESTAATPAPQAVTVDGPLAAGTALVQLGTFETAEIAAAAWDRAAGRFGSLLGDRTRVIQEAMSGGRVFFRLRAIGFTDMADARRLCSALIAEGAECIPTIEG